MPVRGKLIRQVTLIPPRSRSKAFGVADILVPHDKVCPSRVLVVAKGLRANIRGNAYALWLYNTAQDDRLLGFVKPVGGSSDEIQTVDYLPVRWRHFRSLILSLERSPRPNHPHHTVLIASLRPSLPQPSGFTG